MPPVALRYADITNASQLTNIYPVAINCSSDGNNILIPAVTTQQIMVFKMFLVVGGDTVITIKDGSTNLTGAMTFNAGGSLVLDISAIPWFQTSRGAALVLNSTNAVQISGALYYQQKI